MHFNCDVGQYYPHISVYCLTLKYACQDNSVYKVVDIIPKPLAQQQLFLMTVEDAAEEDSSELSEVLITDLSLHRLRQPSSYANSESSGNISK